MSSMNNVISIDIQNTDFTKKSEILNVLNGTNTSFKLQMKIDGMESKFVVGVFGSSLDKTQSLIQFFLGYENTKNNFLLSIEEFLKNSEENLLEPNYQKFNDIFNPYKKDERYYFLENATFRLGSLWDQLAHICNIYFNLGFDKKSVDSNFVFIKKFQNIKNNRSNLNVIKDINNYLLDKNSFGEINAHHFAMNFRNKLIHYCDFNALKFISKYMTNDKDSFLGYPVEYFNGILVFDYLKSISFARQIFEDFHKNMK